MATSEMNRVVKHLRHDAHRADVANLTDGELLASFVSRREPAALEGLVRRHGSMVWGICRRILRNHHDAEDAFQATFLVLTRRAASIVPPEMVGNWLYGVAQLTARKARATRAKRQTRERQPAALAELVAAAPDICNDLQPVLDQELRRLPDPYRAVIVLCDLEGKSRHEAARCLGCPEGTVASRLARARAMLAKRLARHGLAVTGGAVAAALSQIAAASVPASLLTAAIAAATGLAAGQGTAALVSPAVAALTEGVVNAMSLAKSKTALAWLVALGMLTLTGALLAWGQTADSDAPPPAANAESRVAGAREAGRDAARLEDKARSESPGGDRKPQPGDPVQEPTVLPPNEVRRYGDQNAPVDSVGFTPDGKFVLAGTGRSIHIWDAKTGKVRQVLETTGGTPAQHIVRSVAFSKDGDLLAAAGDMFPIHVWSWQTGKRERTFGWGIGAGAVRFLPKANELLVLESNPSVWDARKGELLRKLDPAQYKVNSISVSADGKWALSGNTFDLWDVTTGERRKRLAGPGDLCSMAALTPNGKQAVFASLKGSLWLWDVATDKLVRRFDEAEPQFAYTVVTTRTRPDLETIRKTIRFARPGATLSMVFSPDGRRVLAGGGDGGVRLWEIASGKLVAHFQGGALTQTAAEERDSLVYREPGADVVPPIVPAVAFSPDGRYALTGSHDKTVRLWRLPEPGAK